MRCFDVIVNLLGNITQFALEVVVNGWRKVLFPGYGGFVFGDDIDNILRVGKNASGVMKFSPVVVEVLLVRKIDLEFLIRIWYCYLLILWIRGSKPSQLT